MATFDKTKIANNSGWNNGVKVKTFVVDFQAMISGEGLASTDDVNILKVPANSSIICFGGAVEILRAAVGTTATMDVGIAGGVEFDGAVDLKGAAGTVTAFDTSAAYVLYNNSTASPVYVTLEPTLTTVTDAGKVAVTLVYCQVAN